LQLKPKLDQVASIERENRCDWILKTLEENEGDLKYLKDTFGQFVKARKRSVNTFAKVANSIRELDEVMKMENMICGSVSAAGNNFFC
jgi:hypothetical protein